MRVFYAEANFGEDEINAAIDVLRNNRLSLMAGDQCSNLEKKVARLFGKPFGLMTNSGSSANLLAIKSLDLPKGTKVLTPALTFSTTVAPIYQLGLKAHFVGVLKNKFIVDPDQIEACINKKTVAILIPNLLGNIPDWKKISQIAKKYNLKVIEDSADTIGYSYNNGNTGKYSKFYRLTQIIK